MSGTGPTGLATLATPAFQQTQAAIGRVVTGSQIVALAGEAGVGKSFAAQSALEAVGVRVVRLSACFAPTGRCITAAICGDHGNWTRSSTYTTAQRAASHLRSGKYAVLIDECERMAWSGAGMVCYLHDREELAASFVLLYRSCAEAQRFGPLAARTTETVEFVPLELDELLSLLPSAHSIYRSAYALVLGQVDEIYCRGRLREWERFTEEASAICQQAGTGTLGAAEARKALERLLGREPPWPW